MKPTIVYWSNIPAPYMVERFNALVNRGTLRFEAWFSARTEAGRSWIIDETRWLFPYRYLTGLRWRGHAFVVPTPLVVSDLPEVIVTLYAGPAFLLGSWVARRRGVRIVYWVEPTFDAVVRRRPWKERLKKVAFTRADGIFTTGEDGRRFVRRYSVPEERIFVVPHVVDYQAYARPAREASVARDDLRRRLGVRGVTFLYVGHLSPAKGVDHLVDAFASVASAGLGEVSLLLVGEGAAEAELKARCRESKLDNVVFAGFQHAESLPRFYAAADVFVFPTLGDTFGMVVSEAMACGLAIVASSASGEISERVVDGETGFVVPPANSALLAERMALLARDHELRTRMGEAAATRVSDQSPDTWADAFEKGINGILRLPRAVAR